MALVQIVPILYGAHADLLGSLSQQLERSFSLRVEIAASGLDPDVALDRARGQYNSRILLAQLLRESKESADRVLGVTGLDLFIPVLTFVFGEAQLGGRAAIVSSYRLENELYGLPPASDLLLERLVKESVHELGHTFGLGHCRDSECVMASSTTVDGVDVKSAHFCESCERVVRNGHRG